MKKKVSIKETWFFHLLLIPGILLLLVFAYFPMIGIVIAFQDFNPVKGFFASDWIGWENFKFMLKLPDTPQIIKNTINISLMKVIAGLIVPIAFALLVNEVRISWYKRSIQTLVYLPHFLSWVILGGILTDLLSMDGAINSIIKALGFDGIFFLGEHVWFRVTIVLTDVWKEFGFSTIVYLAALTGVSPVLYEAAEIDGANRWKKMINITIPGILPVIILMSTLSLGNVLNAGFDQIFNLYNPLVMESADIIDTYVYRVGLVQAQYGLATAVGLFKSIIGFILIVTSYRLAYRYANYRIF